MTATANRKVKTRKSTQSQVALHLMVNQLSVSTMPAAMRSQSTIVNDIPAGLHVDADQHKLAAVLGSLMDVMISHTSNCAIHISAKSFGNVMLLHLKGESKLSGPAFAGSLDKVQMLANNVGGTVGITSYRNNVTTVALSFIGAGFAA